MRKVAVGSLLVLLLGTGGCTSSDGDGGETAADEQSTCEQLLGASGVDWVKDSVQEKTGVASDSEDLKSARSLFYGYAKAWDSKSSQAPTFTNSELCRVVKTAGATTNKNLSVYFGASIVPFDFSADEGSGASGTGTATPVNADVKLVHEKGRNGSGKYYVYVKCQVSGAPAGQEDEVPIEGVMHDTLTGDTDVRVHMKYLLHSAGVVARSFDCQNNPTVPSDPPAAVK